MVLGVSEGVYVLIDYLYQLKLCFDFYDYCCYLKEQGLLNES